MSISSRDFNFFLPSSADYKPTVAISSCLVGKPVRYDGTGKLLTTASYLADQLTLIEVCPEVGAGMSVPRPPIQLVNSQGRIEAIGRVDPSLKVTAALKQFSVNSADYLSTIIDGYIFKSRSPSCGVNSTPIYASDKSSDKPIKLGSGLQAYRIQKQMPWLPLREETDLEKSHHCGQFILQCRVLHDLRTASEAVSLQILHQHYRPLINSMDADSQNELERWQHSAVKEKYWTVFMTAMGRQLDS